VSGDVQRTNVNLRIGCILLADVFQLSSEEKKRKVVADMEGHLNELRRDIEQLKQNMDPAADTKYNNTIHVHSVHL